jgi:hypothetical protein
MATLLQKARAIGIGKRGVKTQHDPEELLELAVAWFKGEIASGRQIKVALGNGGSPMTFAFTLKHAIAAGRIRIEVIK